MRSRQEPWWLPKEKASPDPLRLPFIASGCDSNSFAVFGLFRKLFWFLSPENFFPLHPSLLPTTTLWGCHVSVFHVKNLENPFKPNRKTVLLSLKSTEFVSLSWHRTSAGLKISPVSKDFQLVDLRGMRRRDCSFWNIHRHSPHSSSVSMAVIKTSILSSASYRSVTTWGASCVLNPYFTLLTKVRGLSDFKAQVMVYCLSVWRNSSPTTSSCRWGNWGPGREVVTRLERRTRPQTAWLFLLPCPLLQGNTDLLLGVGEWAPVSALIRPHSSSFIPGPS